METEEVRQVITALQSGDRTTAHQLASAAIRGNPRDEAAWMILSMLAEEPEHQVDCLMQVLAINPINQWARDRLAKRGFPLANSTPTASVQEVVVAPPPPPEPVAQVSPPELEPAAHAPASPPEAEACPLPTSCSQSGFLPPVHGGGGGGGLGASYVQSAVRQEPDLGVKDRPEAPATPSEETAQPPQQLPRMPVRVAEGTVPVMVRRSAPVPRLKNGVNRGRSAPSPKLTNGLNRGRSIPATRLMNGANRGQSVKYVNGANRGLPQPVPARERGQEPLLFVALRVGIPMALIALIVLASILLVSAMSTFLSTLR